MVSFESFLTKDFQTLNDIRTNTILATKPITPHVNPANIGIMGALSKFIAINEISSLLFLNFILLNI